MILRLRSLLSGAIRSRGMLSNVQTPLRMQKKGCHHDGYPQPFDNMPFKITNRYLTTVIFAVLFGSGLWAPFFILWYAMAKRTM